MITVLAVPPPVVTIQRDPPPPRALSTGDSLTITCSADISNHVDTLITVIIDIQWTERNVLRGAPHVTVSLELSRPPYESSVSISSLTCSDTRTYQCHAQMNSSGNPLVSDNGPILHVIDIFVCKWIATFLRQTHLLNGIEYPTISLFLL